MDEKELQDLRAAVNNSPNNIPLRKYLAKALLKVKKYEEAEIEFKEVLKLAPNADDIKLGLATTFLHREKISVGLVLVEELLQKTAPSPKVYFLHAQLLFKTKRYDAAKEAYYDAIALDPNLEDSFFESELNLNINETTDEREKLILGGFDEVFDDFENDLAIERPSIKFDDVGGMETVKKEIRLKIIHPLEHQELYKAYGKKIGGGILMYGPPGCGKTHLARATAGEISANFISVGINDILDMFIGQSERNLHEIFEKARRLKPCVLFFDEVDALGANRRDMRQNAGRSIINMFLDEMDGITHSNDGVLILAATNTPWHLDPAFRRPGRFDRIVFVPPPDAIAREAIFTIKLKDKPIGNIEYKRLIKRTQEYSGADIEAIIDIAVEAKLEQAMQQGGIPIPLETKDLETAIKKHRPTTKEWFGSAKNYALFANESGYYDDILSYLNIKKQ